jgi:aspartate/methionine/tyrosine aminotransferase
VPAAPYWEARRYQPHPRGIAVARQAVANYYRQRTPPVTFDPTGDIVMTASTSEAYALLFALLTDPGDNVLVPDISYPLFDYLAAMYRVELPHLPTRCTARLAHRPMAGWGVPAMSVLARC